MKHILTFESFLSESFLGERLSVGQNIIIENDDEDGDFSAGDYTVIALKKGAVVLKGMGNNRLEVTQGALNDAGYTVNESFLGESKELDVIEWDEFVKPDHLLLSLSNGKELRIDRKYVAGGKDAYFRIIDALNDMKRNPKAKAFIQELISKMASNLK